MLSLLHDLQFERHVSDQATEASSAGSRNSMRSSRPDSTDTSTGPSRRSAVDDVVDQHLRRRSAGGDARPSRAPSSHVGIELAAVGDQIARDAFLAADLAQAVGVGAVGGADDQDDVDELGELAHRGLAVLRRVADVARLRADDVAELLLQRRDDALGVVDAERGLGDVGDRRVGRQLERRRRRPRSAPGSPGPGSAPWCLRPRDGRHGRSG